jgi:hypothetical protein
VRHPTKCNTLACVRLSFDSSGLRSSSSLLLQQICGFLLPRRPQVNPRKAATVAADAAALAQRKRTGRAAVPPSPIREGNGASHRASNRALRHQSPLRARCQHTCVTENLNQDFSFSAARS